MFFRLLLICLLPFSAFALPKGFVYLKNVDPGIVQSVRYYSDENFTGKKVKGYEVATIILTEQAALALKNINKELNKDGYKMIVYDGYRPVQAVKAFVEWGKNEEESKKHYYFPEISKKEVFDKGFVAYKSSHSRGSTVDVSIMRLKASVKKPVYTKRGNLIFLDDNTEDMGMHFDFFGKESWSQSPIILSKYNKKRKYLQEKMAQQGFKGIEGEWWHFTLIDEPFPNTYFDFIVK